MRSGAARIALIVALVAGGGALLATGFSGSAGILRDGASSPTHTISPTPATPTHHSPGPTPSPQTTGVSIAVFNATAVSNLASKAQRTLVRDGYIAPHTPSDSPIKPISRTAIYFRGGAKAAQNRADAQYIADKYFHGATISELGDAFINLAKGADVAIVLGNDYATSVGH